MAMSAEAATAAAAAYLWMCAQEYPQTWQLKDHPGAEIAVPLSAQHWHQGTNQRPTHWTTVTVL